MRDFFVIVGSLLIAVLVAAFAVPRFIDWAPYKREIETRIHAATGIDLALAGPLRIEILPKLALNAQDVIIDTKDAKVSAARLRAEVSVATLFGAMPHLVALELDGGVVKLSEAAAGDPVAALIGVLSKDHALQIDAVTLNTIAITRADGDTPLATIERGEATLPAYQGPLRLSAEGVLGAISGRGRLAIGPPEADLNRHVSIAFDADGDADARGWRLTFEGQATQNGQTPVTLDGAVALAQSDRVGLRTGSGGTGDAPSWRAQAKAHGELRALRFDGIEISREQAAALRLTGQGALDLTADPKLTLDLAARRLVLDPLAEANPPDPKIVGASGSLPLDEALKALAGGVTASLPSWLSVDLNLGAETAELADESFGNLHLSGTASADAVAISSLSANWAGRGDIAFSGSAVGGDKALARGHIEVKAPDAAAFLQGLGLASEAASTRVPLTLAGELRLDQTAARIDALDLSLAGSQITGRLTVTGALAGRSARVEAELASRDLDLDSWPLGAVTHILPASVAGRLQMHVERLRAGRGAGDVGRLDMSLSRGEGRTLIDKLQLQGFEGLSLSGAGAIGGAGSSFDAHITAPKAAPLAALSRLVLPQGAVEALTARRNLLEPLSLTVSARREAASPMIDVTLSGTAASSHIEAKTALGADFVPSSGEVALSAPEASTLLNQIGLAIAPGDPLGRGEVKIAVKPTDAGSLALTANASAGQGTLSGDGTLSFAGSALEGHGGFSAATPNLASAQRLLGFVQHLDGDQRLEISGGWTLSSDNLALERLNARFLGMSLTGTLNLGLGSGARLTGTIEAPALSIPGLAALTLGPTRTQAGQGPWAAVRFPAYLAPKLPVSISLAAPVAELGASFTGRNAKLSLELDERGLALASGTAELAGGELGGDWRIERDGGLARSALRLSAEGIDLKSLVPGAGFAGQLSGRLELAGAGETLSQIVASSGGSGSLRLSDGWLEQATIAGLRRSFTRAVADDNLMDKARLAAVVAGETARGALTGANFEAPLVATNGILRTTIPRLDLQGGDGAEATATLDLKTLSLDARLGLATVLERPDNPVPLAAAITWKGPLFALKREADAGALLQTVSVERLRIELERIELLEYDQREQAMFIRRLKAGRQKALPLPPQPEPATPALAPPTPPASPGAEGETAAKEPANPPSSKNFDTIAPASPEPVSPPPLVRAPQPPSRPAQSAQPDAQPAARPGSGRQDAVPFQPVEPTPQPGAPLSPLPPEIAVPSAPAVIGVPARPTPSLRPPIVLHPRD
jgi:hypothetical protein